MSHPLRKRLAERCVFLVITMLVLGTGMAGCGGGKGQKGDVGTDTVYVNGKISLRGSTPFELLLLEADDGTVYMIDASPMADELKRLEDMPVGVTATVLPDVKGDSPALSIHSYELLPLRSGERPVMGVIRAGSVDAVLLVESDGTRWLIEGEFKTVFSSYVGAKVWVVGDAGFDRLASGATSDRYKTIKVLEYGVIKEPR